MNTELFIKYWFDYTSIDNQFATIYQLCYWLLIWLLAPLPIIDSITNYQIECPFINYHFITRC